MTSEPDSTSAETGASSQNTTANQPVNSSRTFAPRPNLGRGFGAYTHPQAAYPRPEAGYSSAPPTRKSHPVQVPSGAASFPSAPEKSRRHPFAWLMPWRTQSKQLPAPLPISVESVESRSPSRLALSPNGFPAQQRSFTGAPAPVKDSQPYSLQPRSSPSGASSADGAVNHPLPRPESLAEGRYSGAEEVLIEGPISAPSGAENAHSPTPRFWERQPYSFLAHCLLVSGALTTAWFFGILAAQILPGRFSEPPLQESFLRKSSRLTHRLWHFPQLWQMPTAQVRIDAVPLPETGPILGPLLLSPIERQPLIDELNAVETEILTLDRRLQSLERQLGKPPYQGMGIESRINTMRAAIDPPVQDSAAPQPYEPVARNPSDTLLDVAKLAITLPSDALFRPGDADLKDAVLLERVLDQLVDYPAATISVRVHSDDQVSAIASREYTLAQANTLARYLQRNLSSSHRWITVGMGSTQPLSAQLRADDIDAVERQRNRRIEILVDTR